MIHILRLLLICLAVAFFSAEALPALSRGRQRLIHQDPPLPMDWSVMPGVGELIGQPAAVNFDGKIYIFGINRARKVWMQVLEPYTVDWQFPEALPDVPGLPPTARPAWGPYVSTSAERLYLFVQAGDRILWNTKEAGKSPLEGWDSTWSFLGDKVEPGTLIAAVHINGRQFLLRYEQWGEVTGRPDVVGGLSVRWQRQNDFVFYGAIPQLPEAGSSGAPAYIFTAKEVNTPIPDQNGPERYVRYETAGLPALSPQGCIIDSAKGYGYSTVTGYQYVNEEGDKEFVAFYTDEKGQIFAVMEGHDGFGLEDGREPKIPSCSTWAGAAKLFIGGSGPPAVVPNVGTGSAVLFTDACCKNAAGMVAFKLFRADRDIVPEISTRARLRDHRLPAGVFSIRGVPRLIPGFGGACAPEMVAALHGWTNPPEGGQDKFQKARRGLRYLEYPYPVIGFTWPADQNESFLGIDDALGFDAGKAAADHSAAGFAMAIQEMKQACPAMKIRLVSHSLGGRVLLQR
jgi:hypothetical protein